MGRAAIREKGGHRAIHQDGERVGVRGWRRVGACAVDLRRRRLHVGFNRVNNAGKLDHHDDRVNANADLNSLWYPRRATPCTIYGSLVGLMSS